MFYVLLCVTVCPFKFCNHLDGDERGGCFAQFVFLVPRDCCVALPCGAIGLSAVRDRGISLSYSLTFFIRFDFIKCLKRFQITPVVVTLLYLLLFVSNSSLKI